MSTQSVFWLTFKTVTNPVVDVTTLEQYAPVERSLTKYLTALKHCLPLFSRQGLA